MDFLFTGRYENSDPAMVGQGLLYFCGLASGNHDGQLKRICGPCISLLRWLVQFDTDGDDDNIFFDRFVALPQEELLRINFIKHMLNEDKSTLGMASGRSGSTEDAMELLSLIVTCHVTVEGDEDPLDVNSFLMDNKVCRDRFTAYLQKTASEQAKSTAEKFREHARAKTKQKTDYVVRPSAWDDVIFKAIPIQEGEGVAQVVVEEDPLDRPVPDPFGLVDIDLKAAQAIHQLEQDALFRQQEQVQEDLARRASMLAGGKKGGHGHGHKHHRKSTHDKKGRSRRSSMDSMERINLIQTVMTATVTEEDKDEATTTGNTNGDTGSNLTAGATMLGGRR